MDPIGELNNQKLMLENQVRELQASIDRMAEVIHAQKHDRRILLEGIRARVKFVKERVTHTDTLVRELLEALDKELIGG